MAVFQKTSQTINFGKNFQKKSFPSPENGKRYSISLHLKNKTGSFPAFVNKCNFVSGQFESKNTHNWNKSSIRIKLFPIYLLIPFFPKS